MPVLDDSDRQTLARAGEDLAELQTALETAARQGALDGDLLERLERTATGIAGRLNHDLPVHLDPDSRDEIRRRLIDLLTLEPAEEGRPLDRADRALLEIEAVRHVMRDVLQEQPPADLRRSDSLVELLDRWLAALPVASRAELLGLEVRQLQRLRSSDRPSTHRMITVARLVALLRHGWTDEGVAAWFRRSRHDLGGQSPLELLDDPAMERDLLRAARSGRVQGGD